MKVTLSSFEGRVRFRCNILRVARVSRAARPVRRASAAAARTSIRTTPGLRRQAHAP